MFSLYFSSWDLGNANELNCYRMENTQNYNLLWMMSTNSALRKIQNNKTLKRSLFFLTPKGYRLNHTANIEKSTMTLQHTFSKSNIWHIVIKCFYTVYSETFLYSNNTVCLYLIYRGFFFLLFEGLSKL